MDSHATNATHGRVDASVATGASPLETGWPRLPFAGKALRGRRLAQAIKARARNMVMEQLMSSILKSRPKRPRNPEAQHAARNVRSERAPIVLFPASSWGSQATRRAGAGGGGDPGAVSSNQVCEELQRLDGLRKKGRFSQDRPESAPARNRTNRNQDSQS
jgi:hypothetical protein